MTWPSAPTARNGQYSAHHRACPEVRKVHERLSWKFHRFATRKAKVENRWYQRTLKSLSGSPHTAPSGSGPSRLTTISATRFTATPVAPTSPKRMKSPSSRRRLAKRRSLDHAQTLAP